MRNSNDSEALIEILKQINETVPQLYGFIFLISGVLICLFGHKIFRATVAVPPIIIPLFVFLPVFQMLSQNTNAAIMALIIPAFITYLIAYKLYKVSVFFAGGMVGFLLFAIIAASAISSNLFIPFGIVGFVVGGFLSLKFERPFMALYTSWSGSGMAILGIRLLKSGSILDNVKSRYRGDSMSDGEVVFLMVLFLIMFIVGCFYQLKVVKPTKASRVTRKKEILTKSVIWTSYYALIPLILTSAYIVNSTFTNGFNYIIGTLGLSGVSLIALLILKLNWGPKSLFYIGIAYPVLAFMSPLLGSLVALGYGGYFFIALTEIEPLTTSPS